jgi:hypothetical protein
MKKNVLALTSIALVLVLLTGCDWFKKKENVVFTGSFIDTEGKAIEKGVIEIYVHQADGKEPRLHKIALTSGKSQGELPKGNKYVVNVKARGYGLVSKVFYGNLPSYNYQLKAATVVSFNPTIGGLVRDSKNNCIGSLSAQANWAGDPWKELPLRINSSGQISGFGMSPELEQAYNFHAKSKPCNNNISVAIPANALNTSASVNVAISAIDLFSPDGMPGDYSLSLSQNRVGFMESYGAFSLEIYDGEKNFNLNNKEKKTAKVTFAVSEMAKGKTLPQSIPLVYYDEKNGVWVKDTEATYNKEIHAYEAEVTHFSAINLDLEKTNTSCLGFIDPAEGTTDAFVAPYRVEVTAPASTPGGVPRVSSRTVNIADLCTTPANQFALTRLPADTELSIAFFDNVTTQPKGVYVFKTGVANSVLQDPTRPGCAELGLCGTTKPIQTNDFAQPTSPSSDFYISGCKVASNQSTISIAMGPTAGASLDLTNFQLKFRFFDGGTEVCATSSSVTGLLSTLSKVYDNLLATPNIKVYQFSVPIPTCGSTFSDIQVELVDTSTSHNSVANTFTLVNCI